MSQRPTGPACGNNPNYRMSDGDRQAVENFRAYLTARAELRTRIAAAMRPHYHCTGDPEQHVIRCSCGWLDPGPDATRETDWDSHIADVVLALLPAPADRGAVLREVEQHVRALARATFQPYYRSAYATLADDISRMANEAQPAQPQHDETPCQCGHGKAYHDVKYGTPRCRLCPERGEWKWDHAFTSAAGEQQS
jgi:hypothetical protein